MQNVGRVITEQRKLLACCREKSKKESGPSNLWIIEREKESWEGPGSKAG